MKYAIAARRIITAPGGRSSIQASQRPPRLKRVARTEARTIIFRRLEVNISAIAAGIVSGLGLGRNAMGALITRGLAEMGRLGVRLGAKPLTFLGLSGLGDLTLTCTGDLSRNRSVGIRLGKGEKLKDILGSMKAVAEGVRTCDATVKLSRKLGVEMPISEKVWEVLYEDKPAKQAVVELMQRPTKHEFWDLEDCAK